MQSLILFSVLLFSTIVFAGDDETGWVSGGGDPLRIYLQEGRDIAAEAVTSFRASDLPAKTRADVREWILANRTILSQDIQKSAHLWTLGDQETCGLTLFQPFSTISLSLPSCRSISSSNEAAKLLIHESVHHFGISDEVFADSVAIALGAAWEAFKVDVVPLCKNKDQEEMLNRLAGEWRPDMHLTKRIGGNWGLLPGARVSFLPKSEVNLEFKGIGGCAIQAGRMNAKGPRREFNLPYLVVSKDGDLFLVLPKPKHPGEVNPPFRGPRRRIPFREDTKIISFSLLRAKNPQQDLLFLGDEEGEDAQSVFSHGP